MLSGCGGLRGLGLHRRLALGHRRSLGAAAGSGAALGGRLLFILSSVVSLDLGLGLRPRRGNELGCKVSGGPRMGRGASQSVRPSVLCPLSDVAWPTRRMNFSYRRGSRPDRRAMPSFLVSVLSVDTSSCAGYLSLLPVPRLRNPILVLQVKETIPSQNR